MYFANNSGLLEFNGEAWNLYPSPNGSVLRSVEEHQGRVYSGCYMDFGYWDRDPRGRMQYHSLSAGLEEALLEDEQFWNIQIVDDWVLFQSLQRIYAYHVPDSRFEIIPSEASRAQLFASGKRIYFLHRGNIMVLENGEVQSLASVGARPETVVGLVQLQGRPVFLTEEGNSFEAIQGELEPVSFPGRELLKGVKIYSCLQLRDGALALGTISSGLLVVTPEGQLKVHLKKENGLNNNTVLTLEEDRSGDLWLGLDHGISVLNRSSSFQEFNDATGQIGEVYAATLYEGDLYIGTNQGLFRASYPIADSFRLVPGTEGQVWVLKVFNGALLGGHHRGTFEMEGDRVRWLSDLPGTWDFKSVPGNDSLLLQGHYQGLSLLVQRQGRWEFRNTLGGHEVSSRFFEFAPTGELVVNHEYKGIYILEPDKDLSRLAPAARYEPLGKGASLFRYRDQLYYATDSVIYAYEEQSRSFSPDSALTLGMKAQKDRPFGVLVSDNASGRLWGFGNGTIHYVEAGTIDRNLNFNKIHVPGDFRLNMGVLGFECLAPLQQDKYLIGRSNGFVVLDLGKLSLQQPEPFLFRVLHSEIGRPPEPASLELAPQFHYKQNNLSFEFSVPQYDKFKEVQYQYRLDGLEPSWSIWSPEHKAAYNNLPYGSYRFMVSARFGDSVSEEPAVYVFAIQPPWYMSRVAIAVYVILFLALLMGIHGLYRAYFRRQHLKMVARDKAEAKRNALKAKKKVIEARNAQLRQEIESKNRELAVSTMSLIRKNEFLNTLKAKLNAARDFPEVRTVIRAIDKNIGSEDDWKFFEEAFNNADKDFLRTIKERHPDLTPNDLRLCAYLRLNLSSKEIAPLLNISVRSIEVKRYRLRKKMNLPHEQSLTEYILSL